MEDFVSMFVADPQGVTWRGGGETLTVTPWGRDSLRVRARQGGAVLDTDWALLPPGEGEDPAEVAVDGPLARITHGDIAAELRAETAFDYQVGHLVATCSLTIRDGRGRVLLEELDAGGSLKLRARAYRPLPGGSHHVTVSFAARPGERFYGMGLYQQDVLDLKGCTLELAHRNSQASVPFCVSDRGYGLLWHNPAVGRATFARNRTEWVAESTDQIDYWVTAGDTPARILARYADATGHAPMMPEHGLGLWQSRLRYWNQDQLLEVAHEYSRRDLPLDVIVADFFHWPRMGDFRFEEEFWPDPAAMVKELERLGIRLMVSVWPQVSLESENFAAFFQDNLLVGTERGNPVQMGFEGPSRFVDFTDPRARRRVWELCRASYHGLGIELFWLDEAEPEYGVYDFDQYRYALGPAPKVGNIYPQAYARAFFEGQRAAGQADVVNLVRCAWAGSQRYGALIWSGDIPSTFDALRAQICAGLNMGMSGIPWFTTDIGGFHGGDPDDPAFRELLVRWFQFATFCPVLRMHGDRRPASRVTAADGSRRCPTGAANELWSFGDGVGEILVHYLHVRERLRPYLREVMRQAHEQGQPVMRAMFHGFPDDPACWDLTDQYLLGPDVLVAPVVAPGAGGRYVHLPAGSTWHDAWTGQEHAGGRQVWVDTPLAVIPLFTSGDTRLDLRPADAGDAPGSPGAVAGPPSRTRPTRGPRP
jgi:alpha-D-xyloside xylohydrolase